MIDTLFRRLRSRSPASPPRSSEAFGEAAAYELAYREAQRAIELQAMSLGSLRTRAGLVLSTATLVAGFLGPSAIAVGKDVWLLIAGTGSYVAATLITLGLLLGVSDWRAVIGTRRLLADYVESDPPASMAEIHRSLAWHMEDDWTNNERRLRRLNRLLGVGGALVAIETVGWLLATST